jgi:hypothetical protein
VCTRTLNSETCTSQGVSVPVPTQTGKSVVSSGHASSGSVATTTVP